MFNYKLTIEYDGTCFKGWQKQNFKGSPRVRTVQGEMEKAISRILKTDVRLTGASRTDSGVHALAQTANFVYPREVEIYGFINKLNDLLPEDIVVKRMERVCREFSSRYSARLKEYEYRIWNPNSKRITAIEENVWRIKRPLNIALMRKAALVFVGRKDFISVGKKDASGSATVCNIESITVKKRGDSIFIRFKGDRFLWNMARNIVNILVRAGLKDEELPKISDVIAKNRIVPSFRKPAPARGLFLTKVVYYKD